MRVERGRSRSCGGNTNIPQIELIVKGVYSIVVVNEKRGLTKF